jgi:uncharacterized protein (DUF305 family)
MRHVGPTPQENFTPDSRDSSGSGPRWGPTLRAGKTARRRNESLALIHHANDMTTVSPIEFRVVSPASTTSEQRPRLLMHVPILWGLGSKTRCRRANYEHTILIMIKRHTQRITAASMALQSGAKLEVAQRFNDTIQACCNQQSTTRPQ